MKKAPLPFTTSTARQEASRILVPDFTNTVIVIRSVDVKGQGTVGLITYLERIRSYFRKRQSTGAEYIAGNYGENYIAGEKTTKRTVPKYRMHMRQSGAVYESQRTQF